MAATDELINVRHQLETKLHYLRGEIEVISRALESLTVIERLLASEAKLQPSLPGTGLYADIKPEPLALKIVESKEDHDWTVQEVVQAAKEGGKDLSKYRSAYSVFYASLNRLAKKGRLQIIKKEGTKLAETGTYFRKKSDSRKADDPLSEKGVAY